MIGIPGLLVVGMHVTDRVTVEALWEKDYLGEGEPGIIYTQIGIRIRIKDRPGSQENAVRLGLDADGRDAQRRTALQCLRRWAEEQA